MPTETRQRAGQTSAGTAPAQGSRAEAFKADTWRQFGSFGWGLALRGIVTRRNYRAIATLRLCQWAARRNGILSAPLLTLGRVLHHIACGAAGIDLPWQTSIGPGFALTHGWGTVVTQHAVIGRNVTLFHGVTVGGRDRIRADGSRSVGYPVLEDEVWIGPHAAILGPVTIGCGSRIAAGACVFESVPAHCIVVGNPATIVKTGCAPDVVNRWEPPCP